MFGIDVRILVAAFVGVALIVSFVTARKQAKPVDAAWETAAGLLGLSLRKSTWRKGPSMEGTLRTIPVEVTTYKKSGNRGDDPDRRFTRFEASVPDRRIATLPARDVVLARFFAEFASRGVPVDPGLAAVAGSRGSVDETADQLSGGIDWTAIAGKMTGKMINKMLSGDAVIEVTDHSIAMPMNGYVASSDRLVAMTEALAAVIRDLLEKSDTTDEASS